MASVQAREHTVRWSGMKNSALQAVRGLLVSEVCTGNHGDGQSGRHTREMSRDRKEQLSHLIGGHKRGDDPSPGTEGKS